MQSMCVWGRACISIAAGLGLSTASAFGQSATFTYQGRLENGGTPATGLHDFHFRLFNAIVEGAQVGITVCVDNVNVTDGLFTVGLNFGPQFAVAPRFLEIEVRPDTGQNCNNAAGFTLLGPRQLITAVPMANHATSAFNLDAAGGSPTNVVTVDGTGQTRVSGELSVVGTFTTFLDAFINGNAVVADRLGIGALAPERPLHIRADDPVLVLQDTSPATGQLGYVTFWNNVPIETAWVGFGTPESPDFSIVNARDSGDIELWPSSSGGGVGIAVDNPSFLLHVNGSAGKPGGGTWSVASDVRLKKNIAPLDSALERMLALRGMTYEYVDPEAIHELPGVQMGMIAQDVEAVFPDWVDEGPNGYKRLTFRGFEALTVEALREMKSLADADAAKLRQENTDLRRRLEALETAVARLAR